ncbi:uncharacterized protein BCR38DRAFT_509354, partial [Pseudomassariella vexata]
GCCHIYPNVRCIASGKICQATAGMSEISTATDYKPDVVRKVHFISTDVLFNDIAGINHKLATLGSMVLPSLLSRWLCTSSSTPASCQTTFTEAIWALVHINTA